jgi:hypothetical protein
MQDAMGPDTGRRAVADPFEHMLSLWRSAERAVRSDPNRGRRRDYDAAIAAVLEQLGPYASARELADAFWNIRLAATAQCVRGDGRVLNEHVVAAAACWLHLRRLVAARRPSM